MIYKVLILIGMFLIGNCNVQEKIKSIKVESRTRGYHEVLTVSQELLFIHFVQSPKESRNDTFAISKLEWEKLVQVAQEIPIKEIESLNAPSSESRTDRALSQTLEVTMRNEDSYVSPSYDKGNPPKSLQELVSGVLSLIKKR